jgi:hypothetical protein
MLPFSDGIKKQLFLPLSTWKISFFGLVFHSFISSSSAYVGLNKCTNIKAKLKE